jgi:hypothetical protein
MSGMKQFDIGANHQETVLLGVTRRAGDEVDILYEI